jgi:2-dehydropantoate 2-reductase
LLAGEHWLSLVRELMHEVISSGNAFGLKISEALAQELIDKTKIMAAYKPSTLVDFERGSPVELDSLFLEPLRRAETKGVRTPRLRALAGVLEALSDSRP